ncbi:MAG TPA: VCBS repeat-containing protein, partial [Bacteroidetes bacterium]|nr:VCBS repeat-containing protein [Bacteroidota bacterium]
MKKMKKQILFVVLLFVAFSLRAQTFTDIQARLTGVSGSACTWIDYDQDGDLDVFVTGEFYQGKKHVISTKLYRNDRHDHFTGVFSPVVNVYRGAFDWADEDLDGDEDLFITGQDAAGRSVSRLYINNKRTTQFLLVKVGIPGLKDGSVQWGDYDGDGDPDLLLTGESSSGPVTWIYRNDRHNRFSRLHAGLPGVHFGVAKWADIDQDGDLDVIVSGTLATGQYVTGIFLNNKGRFVRLPLDFIPVSLSDIAFADEDLDGDLDFVVCGETQDGRFVTKLYKNEGDGYYSLAFPA